MRADYGSFILHCRREADDATKERDEIFLRMQEIEMQLDIANIAAKVMYQVSGFCITLNNELHTRSNDSKSNSLGRVITCVVISHCGNVSFGLGVHDRGPSSCGLHTGGRGDASAGAQQAHGAHSSIGGGAL